MASGNRLDTMDVADASNPPIGIALLAAALAVAGLYLVLVLFSVGGNFANNLAAGTTFETGLAGVVFVGAALVTAGFYAALYGLWTGTRRGWYGTLAILLAPLCLEAVRTLGFALGIGPITVLLQPRVDLPLVAGALLTIGYLFARRDRYLDGSAGYGFRNRR